MTRTKEILIVKLSSMGDVIHSLCVPGALKSLFPGSRITFLVNREYRELLTGNPEIDEILIFERRVQKNLFQTVLAFLSLIRRLREKRYDLVIDLQGLFRSALIGWLSGSRNLVGFANSREGSSFFYHRKIPVPDARMHAVDRYLLIPKSFGWKGEPRFILTIPEEDRIFIDQFMRAEKIKGFVPLIAFQATARWSSKRWPSRYFAELGDMIQKDEKGQIVFLGARDEWPQIEEIVRQMKTSPVIATGKLTIKQLAAFLTRCALLLTNDSGPMHLAVALNIPVVALFGATDFRKTGPYGREDSVLFREISCSPCLRRVCHNTAFPMECLESISPESVYGKMKASLEPWH